MEISNYLKVTSKSEETLKEIHNIFVEKIINKDWSKLFEEVPTLVNVLTEGQQKKVREGRLDPRVYCDCGILFDDESGIDNSYDSNFFKKTQNKNELFTVAIYFDSKSFVDRLIKLFSKAYKVTIYHEYENLVGDDAGYHTFRNGVKLDDRHYGTKISVKRAKSPIIHRTAQHSPIEASGSDLSQTDIEKVNFKEVIIGEQIWMAENLNVSKFRNGDPIPHAKTEKEWERATEWGQPAWCYYDNDPAKGEKYGKLYNWYAVDDPRGLAPEGWLVPNYDDWEKLFKYLAGEADKKMKSTNGWEDYEGESGNGTNESGFSGLPGGCRSEDGYFYSLGNYCYLWSSNDMDGEDAYFCWLFQRCELMNANMGHGYSVRCLKE
jgi:uncharacterized protein (TIGR02145 family)